MEIYLEEYSETIWPKLGKFIQIILENKGLQEYIKFPRIVLLSNQLSDIIYLLFTLFGLDFHEVFIIITIYLVKRNMSTN